MAPQGWHLTERAVRKLAAGLKKLDSLVAGGGPSEQRANTRPAPYVKGWYRVVTNEGGGEYTVRRQQWNAETKALEDLTDNFDPEYNRDQTARDIRAAADAGAGDRVPGWQTTVNGQWLLLLDTSGVTGPAGLSLDVWVNCPKTQGLPHPSWTLCIDERDWRGVQFPLSIAYFAGTEAEAREGAWYTTLHKVVMLGDLRSGSYELWFEEFYDPGPGHEMYLITGEDGTGLYLKNVNTPYEGFLWRQIRIMIGAQLSVKTGADMTPELTP